ncbi:MAG: nucleoside triphosphate pyrophosphohydrolase [Eubacteriales bacterium]
METEKTALPASREEKMAHLLGVKKGQYTFDDLVMIMELLRGEGGCPWDREQDHHSIRNDFIEETYEAVEAIDKDDPVHLREELGDVLLQVVFHARIEDEAGRFDVYDVTNDICEKLIYRHPHVFGEVHVENSQEVLTNWDALKGVEKRAERVTLTDTLRSIPAMEPALMRAQKVGKKAACLDFGSTEEVYRKLDEEIAEVRAAADSGDKAAVEEEMGDLLLTVTSLCRKLGVKGEECLYHATDKFIDRFSRVEQAVLARGQRMEDLPMSELDAIWDSIKHT